MQRKVFCLLMFVLSSLIVVSCSKDDSNDGGNDGQLVPKSLSTGNAFVLSEMSPLMFGYFKVTGLAEGQWAPGETATISPNYSQATFTYVVTSENTATIVCQNKQQISTGLRMYSITLELKFLTANTGEYVLRDVALGTTSSYVTSGTFVLK